MSEKSWDSWGALLYKQTSYSWVLHWPDQENHLLSCLEATLWNFSGPVSPFILLYLHQLWACNPISAIILELKSAQTWPFTKRGNSKVLLQSWKGLCSSCGGCSALWWLKFSGSLPLHVSPYTSCFSPGFMLSPLPFSPFLMVSLGDLIFSHELGWHLCGGSNQVFTYNLPRRTDELHWPFPQDFQIQCYLTEFFIFLPKLFTLLCSFSITGKSLWGLVL